MRVLFFVLCCINESSLLPESIDILNSCQVSYQCFMVLLLQSNGKFFLYFLFVTKKTYSQLQVRDCMLLDPFNILKIIVGHDIYDAK